MATDPARLAVAVALRFLVRECTLKPLDQQLKGCGFGTGTVELEQPMDHACRTDRLRAPRASESRQYWRAMANQQKKILLTGYGEVAHLKLTDAEMPEPGKGELLLRVDHAGVAFADVMMRHGKYPGAPKLPFTPGFDVVGKVVAAGEGTSTPSGTRVAALTLFGGYAQYVVVREAAVVEVPQNVPSEKAVCLGLNYLTAYQMIHHVCHLAAGDTLLVHSASGGVGTAALQLARVLRLTTFGTASSAKLDLVRSLGATAIDHQTQDFVSVIQGLEPSGLTAVFDPIGPKHWDRSRRILKRRGHLVAFGGISLHDREQDSMSRGVTALLPGALKQLLLSVPPSGARFTFFSVAAKDPVRVQADLGALMALAKDGSIDPVIAEVFPLAEAGAAHRLLASGTAQGKVVLDCT